jgi:putative transposase
VAHHVTQRGNRRQPTFFREADYRTYLQIAGEAFGAAGVEVLSYCLMPNHVHLILVPPCETALARAVGAVHLRYTRAINLRERWTGYLWQGRFASFAMDEDHLREAVRYVGLNPVRAGLAARAIDWPWSSVRAHVEGAHDPLLSGEDVIVRIGGERAELFACDIEAEALRKLRRASSTGRPLGASAWIKAYETARGEALQARPRGRPAREPSDRGAASISP